jgi:RNA polymerase II elongation factor ELL
MAMQAGPASPGAGTARRSLPVLFFASQKRPPPPDFTDPLASKRPRISHFTQRSQPTLNGKLCASNGREALLPTPGPPAATDTPGPGAPAPPRVHDPLADVSNDLGHSGQDCRQVDPAPPAPTTHLGLPLLTDLAQPDRLHGASHGKPKKSKKHKDKERPEDRHRARRPDPTPATHAAPPDTPGGSRGRWPSPCAGTQC